MKINGSTKDFPKFAQYLFFRCLSGIVNSLGTVTSGHLAEAVGSLLFLRKRRRQFCLQNLRRAFPEKSSREIEKIGRGSMQAMVKIIFEFIRLPLISKKTEEFISVEGEENVWRALEKGKGVILVVSHFGNWELAGIAAAARGIPLNAVGKPNKNFYIDRHIKRLRGLTGLKTIAQKGAVQSCVRLLKKNQVIAVLIDEHAKKGEVWVNLFGHKAATSGLPATLALKYHSPVIPVFVYPRGENEKCTLAFGEPFALKQTGDYQADIRSNTQVYMDCLQNEIVKRPGEWTLWMHNRWRWEDNHKAA